MQTDTPLKVPRNAMVGPLEFGQQHCNHCLRENAIFQICAGQSQRSVIALCFKCARALAFSLTE